MSDYLISREEVLNLIDTAFESGAFDGRYAYENLVDAVQNLIHPLETDLVSRQAVIDAIETDCSWDMFNEWGSRTPTGECIIEAIKRVPSVEQEKCNDCISREELKQKFQWLAKATKYGNEDSEQQNFSYSTMMMYEIADMIEDAIDNCSSVEPEKRGDYIEKQKAISELQPPTDNWETYADRLYDLAYLSGYNDGLIAKRGE